MIMVTTTTMIMMMIAIQALHLSCPTSALVQRQVVMMFTLTIVMMVTAMANQENKQS